MIQIKRILFLGLLMGIIPGFAQTQKLDAIYLKNGSIIRGKIMGIQANQDIKIETKGVNSFIVPSGEILKMAYGEKAPVAKEDKTGLEVISNFEFMGGNPKNSWGITVITGYKFHSGIYTGLGFGFTDSDNSLVPVFADARYYIPVKGNIIPFFNGQAGYGIVMSSGKKNSSDYMKVSYNGGFLGGGSLGISCNLDKGNALLFSMGYRHMRTMEERIYPDYYGQGRSSTDQIISRMNRLLFTVGFLFR